MKKPARMEYVLQPELKKMLGHFSSLVNVRIGFFALDGRELCVGLGRPVCGYCRTLRTGFGMENQCLSLDRRMFEAASKSGTPVRYACHAGLTEIILPVQPSGRCIGFIMVGQFRAAEQTLPDFSKVRGNPIVSPALRRQYRATPVFSEQQMDDMMHMLRLMVQFMAEHYLVGMNDFDVIRPLIEEIERNPEQTLCIREAAARIGRSPSGLSHLFKKLTGSSFRQFQIERKLDEADRLLQTFPQMPVKEAAHRTGFEDPLYFSRLYRRHRGHSPTDRRAAEQTE